MKEVKKKIIKVLKRGFFLSAGSFMAAAGLELFLIPNKIIDGGVIGISILTSYLTDLPIGLFIFGLNVPFLLLAYNYIGFTFVMSTLYSVSTLALFTAFLHPVQHITDDLLLACVFGGIVLGIGVGTVLRFAGSLDGTEILALIYGPRFGFSVGEVVMVFNIFIMSGAGLVFGWDRAMYSVLTYFVAYKTIDIVVEGLKESKSAMIISDKSEEISTSIIYRLGRPVTHLYGKGGYTREDKEILYCVVTRLELAKLKNIVSEIDRNAFLAVEEVHDVMGGKFSKRAIHQKIKA
ncbi:MAG TPA: YitT family protein [Bacillota bacterium]|nr:YitT family protein [Bacillota bacterium]